MKKTVQHFFLLLLVSTTGFVACRTPATTPEAPLNQSRWSAAADTAQEALVRQFWLPDQNYLAKDNKGDKAFNYWWQAHALDAFCDAYGRTKNKKYLALMDSLHEGVRKKNNGTFSNEYYDDMEWMALACLRAYGLTNDQKYKATADALWADIKTGWSDYMGGGISWKKDQRLYKNTPANAPAAILAARLYQLEKKKEDLDWALKIYDWQKKNLVDAETGLVWDGKNRQGDNKIDKDWKFTYCQGVYIGAGLELYKITKQQEYLQESVQTADFVLQDSFFTANGVLRERGGGDGGLFKGIFIRYLMQLAQEGELQKEKQDAYESFLVQNGEQLWQHATKKPQIIFDTNWHTSSPTDITDSSTQLSGVMLLEALAKLENR